MRGRCAAVFGGTGGIGTAVASKFLQNGMKVAVISRNQANVEAVINYLGAGERVCGLSCDITDEAAVKDVMKTAEQQLGPVFALVNAAGINKDSLLIKTSTDSMMSVLQCNLLGSIITCKAALRHMLPRREGCIINIGSIIGSKGNAGQTLYSASKAGLEGFTKSLAKEVAPKSIRVNLISPGFIETEMTQNLQSDKKLDKLIPLQRMGTPAEVADMAYFLLNATYVTGQVLYVDGGLHVTF